VNNLEETQAIPFYDFQQRFSKVVGDTKVDPPTRNLEFESLISTTSRAQLRNRMYLPQTVYPRNRLPYIPG